MKRLRIWTWAVVALFAAALAAGAILSPWVWLVTALPMALTLMGLVWMWQRETPAETFLRKRARYLTRSRSRQPYRGSALSTMWKRPSAPTHGLAPRQSPWPDVKAGATSWDTSTVGGRPAGPATGSSRSTPSTPDAGPTSGALG